MKRKAKLKIAMAAAMSLLVAGFLLAWAHDMKRQMGGGEPITSLAEQRLLGTGRNPFTVTTEAVTLSGGKADFIEWNGQTLIRRDGVSGKPIWDASRPEKPWEPNRDPVAWLRRLSYFGDDRRPGRLIQPAPDLNGDGTGDLVWVIEGAASILAISGKDGSLLWTYSANLVGPGGPDPAGPVQPELGDPIPALARPFADPVASDVDGDGIADVIAAFAMLDARTLLSLSREPTGSRAVSFGTDAETEPVVVAVSGRTGKWLWNHALPREPRSRLGPWSLGLSLVKGVSGSIVAVVDGRIWIGLDPATGRPRRGPIRLNVMLLRPIQYADLDGDGEPEVLAVGHGISGPEIVAVSTVYGGQLWSAPVAWAPHLQDPSLPLKWPLVSDFDGDGKPEIVIADIGLLRPGAYYRGVRVLDSATGRTRWVRKLSPVIQRWDGLFHLIESPDFDGDGMNDFVAVSLFGRREPRVPHPNDQNWIYVDAISARDGRSFWSWRTEMTLLNGVSPPLWWGRGRDGWPFLALIFGGVSTSAFEHDSGRIRSPVVCLLEASTGRTAHLMQDLLWPRAADLDGDKIEDLWGAVNGELRAFRGERPDARGATVQASLNSRDPRWLRSLPWRSGDITIHPSAFILHPFPLPWSGAGQSVFLAYSGMVGLTLVVIVIPLAILKLAKRRRFRSVRTLAVLPLAVALPLTAYVWTIQSSRPQRVVPTASSGLLGFIVGSTGGLPILAYLLVTASMPFQRRLRWLAGWFVLTAVIGLVIGLIWIRTDMQAMSSFEHYSWSGWYEPVVPAAYYLGAIIVILWAVRGLYRSVKRILLWRAAVTPVGPMTPSREV